MIRKISFLFVLAILPALLSGCGGGGGGGGGIGGGGGGGGTPSPPPPVFRSIGDLPGSGTLPLYGMALEGNYEIDPMPPRKASAQGVGSVESDSSIRIDRSGGQASNLAIRVGQNGEPVEFTRFQELGGVADTTVVLESEPEADGSGANRGIAVFHEYQAFGFWLTELGTGSGRFGGGSFGAPMQANVEKENMATYQGSSSGLYFDSSDGLAKATASKMRAELDFDNDSYVIRMTETETLFSATGDDRTKEPAPALDFTARGDLDGNGKQLGDPSAVDKGFSGSLRGSLYGPNGEEIGGVFDFEGASGRYLGAFGGRDEEAVQ